MLKMDEYFLTQLAEKCTKISEECCKIIIRVSKSLRFGLDKVEPGLLLSNIERLQIELADLASIIKVLHENGIINTTQIKKRQNKGIS